MGMQLRIRLRGWKQILPFLDDFVSDGSVQHSFWLRWMRYVIVGMIS